MPVARLPLRAVECDPTVIESEFTNDAIERHIPARNERCFIYDARKGTSDRSFVDCREVIGTRCGKGDSSGIKSWGETLVLFRHSGECEWV